MIGNDTNRHGGMTVALAAVMATVLLIAAACHRRPVMPHAQFRHLPAQGWSSSMPLTFHPQYDDSAGYYAISLAVRHSNDYPYRNLPLVVDIIAADSTVNRSTLNLPLADPYGNWTGGGFGALYQDTVCLAPVIVPEAARAIVVWQAMQGVDCLMGLNDLGITVTPVH